MKPACLEKAIVIVIASSCFALSCCSGGSGGSGDAGEDLDAAPDQGDGLDRIDGAEDVFMDAGEDTVRETQEAEDIAAEEEAELPPGQLVVLDVEYTHNTETMAFSFFDLPAGAPADWTSPVNYAGGTLHQRLEVMTKPGDKPVDYQMCFFQDEHSSDNHACASYIEPGFTAEGTYTREQDMPDIWQYGVIEWNRSLLDLMLVVKDGDGHPVDTRYGFDGQWDGSPDLSLYYPMQVHFTAVIVPVGGTFTGWPE